MADDPVAAELRWLQDCLKTVAASPESFDLDSLMSRYGRVLAALEAVRELAATWREEPVPSASHAGSVRAANVLRACGAALDQVISRELLGTREGSDDRP